MANLANDVSGLIFAKHARADAVADLTKQRTTGCKRAPRGGDYRMIDFPLSNMVNSRY